MCDELIESAGFYDLPVFHGDDTVIAAEQVFVKRVRNNDAGYAVKI